MSVTSRLFPIAVLVTAAACTVKDTPAPPLTGPSELALRVALQIVPDSILQDGTSQAVLQMEASNPDARPVRGLPLRIEVVFNGVVQDFGTLSSKTVVTGDDGRARVTYTAPPKPAVPSDEHNVVQFRVTPVGTDYLGAIPRSVALRLVPPGVLLPPNSAPVASFVFSPSNPRGGDIVTFDASGTTDDGSPCGAACRYDWEFGDGYTGSGIFTSHEFRTAGNYQVRLTVTDSRGASHTVAQTVQVGASPEPTAAFTYSPTEPVVSKLIFFNAEASRATPPRRIVAYDWDFGSGRTASGVTVSKQYDTPGTYTVTLTVTDDVGMKGTTSQTVTVSNP